MRGIIMGAPTFVAENGACGVDITIDDQQLRGWLLFWDKLDMPQFGTGIHIATAVGDFLKEAGMMEPSVVMPATRLENADVLVWPRFEALRLRDQQQTGKWSLAMGPRSLDVPESVYGGRPGIEVQLLQSLPVPDKDVPLEDILRFKARRGQQFVALWDEVDAICAEYQDDPRRPIAEMAAIKRFARQAREAVEVVEEADVPFRMATVTAKYTALGLIGASASVAFGGGLMEIVGNGILAAAGAAISDAVGFRDTPDKSPFAYVIDYHSEVFSGAAS